MNKLETFVKTIGRGQMGIKVAIATEYEMNKGRGANRNPYLGRVTKVTTFTHVTFCCSYGNAVNNEREREGLDADFVPTSPHGMVWVDYPYYLQSTKDPNTHYLNLEWYKKGNCIIRSVLLVDGKVATETQLQEIAKWVTPRKDSGKSQGVANPILVNRPKFANVLYVGQGARVWTSDAYPTYKAFAEDLWGGH